MKSFTSRALKWKGNTTPCTVRLPDPVVEFIDAHIDTKTIRNRSEFLQHWAAVGTMVMANPELADALDWALSDLSPLPSILEAPMVAEEITVTLDDYGPVTIGDGDGPTVDFVPPEMSLQDEVIDVPEGAVVHLGPEGGELLVPKDSLAETYDDILEKLRAKIH